MKSLYFRLRVDLSAIIREINIANFGEDFSANFANGLWLRDGNGGFLTAKLAEKRWKTLRGHSAHGD